MKPLSLEIDAFGSFAEREEIDFAALAERRLFLIHGPTGAGKSTILEAICFALYGFPSAGSELAAGTHLRSQHASADCPTRVALEFALGEARYRVERAPRQRRESRRAKSGFVEDKPSATLWRLKPGATRDDPGTPLATKPSDVDAEVARLLGLDRAQFRQVILLPQGEFRKLLEASTRDREEILARLFDIDRFADIERRLKQAADALDRELGGLERDRKTLLSQAGVETDEAFDLARKTLAEALAEAQQSLAARVATAEAARKALDAGREVARRFEERATAARELAEHEARAPEFENLRRREVRATRAEGPGERLDARDRSVTEREAARVRLEQAVAASAEARTAAIAAQNEELAYRERVPELRGFEEERATLAAARAAASEVEAKRREYDAGCGRLETLREQVAELRSAFEQAQRAVAEADRAAAGRVDAEAALHSVLARSEAIEARLAWLAQGEASDRRIGALETSMAPLRETVAAGRAEVDALEIALGEARRLDRERVAARLAASLHEGDPCPVCGSEDHPAPARDTAPAAGEAGAADAGGALEAQERGLAGVRSGLEKAAGELAALEGQRAAETRARIELDAEGTRLAARSEQAARFASEARPTLEAEREAAASEQARLRSELDRAVAAETDREARRAALDAAREALEVQTRQELALTTMLEGTKETIEAAHARLPDSVQSVEAIDARLESLVARRERLEAEIEGSRERAGRAQGEQVARERVEGERREALAAAERVAEEAVRALAMALVDGGFEDERSLVEARMDAAARVALRERIGAFDRGREAARERAEATRVATEGIEAVDLASLQQGADAADAARAEAQDRVGGLRERQAKQDTLAETLERQRAESGRLLTRFERVKSLANVASGDNKHRTSFQRFVLAAFLDEVLEVASHSLHRMSKGRYALVRATAIEDRRRRGGLDLAVQDAHTGDERPAATLSGGESFCAALALALGLAEVVQRHSGGTRLDAIFVDEGFGSLDPESLELALGTLVELQSGGRLVGLISHVSELKERIETRLEVTPGRGGSRLALETA